MVCCENCGSEQFEVIDGLSFCSQCQTQSQIVGSQTIVEFSGSLAFGRDTSFKVHSFGATELVTGKKHLVSKKAKSSIPAISWLSMLERMLNAQLDFFIEKGMSPGIREIAMDIWNQYLYREGLAHVEDEELSYCCIRDYLLRKKPDKFWLLYEFPEHSERLLVDKKYSAKIKEVLHGRVINREEFKESVRRKKQKQRNKTLDSTIEPCSNDFVVEPSEVVDSDGASCYSELSSEGEFMEASNNQAATPEVSFVFTDSQDSRGVVESSASDNQMSGTQENTIYTKYGSLYLMVEDILMLDDLRHRMKRLRKLQSERKDFDGTPTLAFPRLIHTISVCYLSLCIMNAPVLIHDLLLWIYEGHLPYLDVEKHSPGIVFIPSELSFFSWKKGFFPSADCIRRICYDMMRKQSRPVEIMSFCNIDPLLERCATLLNLPLHVITLVKDILEKSLANYGPNLKKKWTLEIFERDNYMVASFFIAAKLLFSRDHELAEQHAEWARNVLLRDKSSVLYAILYPNLPSSIPGFRSEWEHRDFVDRANASQLSRIDRYTSVSYYKFTGYMNEAKKFVTAFNSLYDTLCPEHQNDGVSTSNSADLPGPSLLYRNTNVDLQALRGDIDRLEVKTGLFSDMDLDEPNDECAANVTGKFILSDEVFCVISSSKYAKFVATIGFILRRWKPLERNKAVSSWGRRKAYSHATGHNSRVDDVDLSSDSE